MGSDTSTTTLRSLNRPDPDKDEKWVAAAKKRLDDLKNGRVKPIDAETVFDNLLARNEA